jgi:hypothetical protein
VENDVAVKIARLEERLKALDRLIDVSNEERRRAIELASAELARRLEILNHAQARAEKVQGEQVPRETYDIHARANEERFGAVERDLAGLHGRMWLPVKIMGWVLGAAIVAVVAKVVI